MSLLTSGVGVGLDPRIEMRAFQLAQRHGRFNASFFRRPYRHRMSPLGSFSI